MSKPDESVSITAELEDEVFMFRRVDRHLEALPYTEEGYKVHTNTSLARALDKLAGSPFVSMIQVGSWKTDEPVLVKGEKAGTWQNPDVAVFQKHATPSPFGRGEETVMDPSYRRGTELKADDISFSSLYKQGITKYLEKELAPAMFVGKKLKIELYKLAIYEEGGHFDWHRDSTHSDAHHGTVLFALNTEWEGGELMLRHGGIEANIDMHPVPLRGQELRPIVVAFYTDTEHKVMPVTKGVRVVLQYNVEVVGEEPPAKEDDKETPLEEAARRRKHLASHFTTYPNLDKTLIQGVINEIRKLYEQGTNIVAFPLTHLYRLASIKKEYLKGTDSALFDALSNHFDVSIYPVVINFTDMGEDLGGQDCVTYIYKATSKEDDSDSDSDSPSHYGYHSRRRVSNAIKGASFHLPGASAIQQISEKPFLEYIGNESQMGEAKYYGGGMFIKPKNKMSRSVFEGEMSDSGEQVKKKRRAG
ncbi:hypothetical protein AZE42_06318 [Rhizopogon vesiculosus]|uniref:Fe2OG dioxygenase domain-containing protein n=1 Tax=Rhizopogon vesiculosus TaxID=180088 RepID=A0A1J8PVJ8_9AGAM|nr:hypothetical protein AZE42_06318 [Rhizopogon vesiculosus]